MSDYKERMQKEYDELDDRIAKLSVFIITPSRIYDALTHEQQTLLHVQLEHMRAYRDTLLRRMLVW